MLYGKDNVTGICYNVLKAARGGCDMIQKSCIQDGSCTAIWLMYDDNSPKRKKSIKFFMTSLSSLDAMSVILFKWELG